MELTNEQEFDIAFKDVKDCEVNVAELNLGLLIHENC